MRISKLADKFAMKLSLEPRPGFTADLPEDLSPYEPTLEELEPTYAPPDRFLSQPSPMGTKEYLDPIKASIHLLEEKISFGSFDEALDLIFDTKYKLELLAKHLVNKQKKQKKNASSQSEEDELLQEQSVLRQLIDEELGKEDTSILDLLQGRLYEVQKRLYEVQSELYTSKLSYKLLTELEKFANDTLSYDTKFLGGDAIADDSENERDTVFQEIEEDFKPVHLPAILKEHLKYLYYMDIEQLRNERKRLRGIARTFDHAPPYLLQKRIEEVDKLIASYNSRFF
jgi:hypothetical protein